MLLREAKEILKKNGYRLVEDSMYDRAMKRVDNLNRLANQRQKSPDAVKWMADIEDSVDFDNDVFEALLLKVEQDFGSDFADNCHDFDELLVWVDGEISDRDADFASAEEIVKAIYPKFKRILIMNQRVIAADANEYSLKGV